MRGDVGHGEMRWITLGPVERPDMSIVLEPPAAAPGITEQQRGIILEMMANGSYARIILATADLIAVFERLEASGADVIQEPIEHPSGVRDCAFHDPACNLVRIIERRAVMPIRRRSS